MKNITHKKIIISHITPRKDDLNKEVLVCNALLDQSVKQSEHVFLVDHSNLQIIRQSILHDTKHIKKVSIRHLAGNIKRTLRSSYGIEPLPLRQPRHDQTYPPAKGNMTVRLQNIAGYDTNKQHLIHQVKDILKAFLT